MARYVDGECYAYVNRQTTAVNSALSSIISEYESITFSNAVKRIEMDEYIEEVKTEMTGYMKNLSDARFSPTNF